MKYWLMKSEPDVFSIDDLRKKGTENWDGVRNYQARNYMRDEMRKGDRVLFYHSNAKPSGVVGIAEISKEAMVDVTAFDVNSKYYDPQSTLSNPRWVMVEVAYIASFSKIITLEEIRQVESLVNMLVIKKGMRLSVQPVTPLEFNTITKLGQ